MLFGLLMWMWELTLCIFPSVLLSGIFFRAGIGIRIALLLYYVRTRRAVRLI